MLRIRLSKRLWIMLLILLLLTPLGILANGTAFGEWGMDEIKSILGYVPEGLRKFGTLFNSVIPDYSVKGWQVGFKSYLGYFLSALVGVCAILLVTFVLGKFLAKNGGQVNEKKK